MSSLNENGILGRPLALALAASLTLAAPLPAQGQDRARANAQAAGTDHARCSVRLMVIDDVFSISGRGTVVTGRVEAGTIRADQKVVVKSATGLLKTRIRGIEMFRKQVPSARAGDSVGLLLQAVTRDQVGRDDSIHKRCARRALSS